MLKEWRSSVRLTQRSTMRPHLQFRGVYLKGFQVRKRVFKRFFDQNLKRFQVRNRVFNRFFKSNLSAFRIKIARTRDVCVHIFNIEVYI